MSQRTMVTAVAPSSVSRALRPRVLGLLALLVAEGGVLAARFDALPLLDRSQAWWARPLAHAGLVMPAVMAAATVVLLVGGARLWGELEVAVAAAPRQRAWPFLAAHLVAYAAFFRLTAIVFEEDGGGAYAAAWAVTGGIAFAAWIATTLPGRAAGRFARRASAVLVGGALIGALAVAAGQVTVEWWVPLGRSTMRLVHRLMLPFAARPVYAPAERVIGTETFQIEIAPKCSGYQGIGLVSVFLGTYLVAFRRTLRYPNALLLLPLGAGVMWLANGIRIACLIAVGTLVSPDVAIGGFHANSGSLLVCLVSLGLGWAAHRLAFFSTTTARPTTRFTADPTAAHLAPLVAITLTAMATGAATRGGFDVLYGARVLVAAAVLWVFREAYDARGWTWRDAWPAAGTGVGAFVLWLALALATPAHAGDPVADGVAALAAPERGVWLAVRLLGAVVAAPIAEELAFRGYLARRLAGRDFTAVDPTKLGWLAIATSSLLFGLMHDRVVAGTAAGVLYALAYRRRGSLGDAVVAHATTNLLLVSVVLATGRWSLW